MRKIQQAKIFELLQTLGEAHGELKKQAELKKHGELKNQAASDTISDSLTNLLADCQDFAIQIGEHIESIEGEGTQTVALLEEYCDLLYKASKGELGDLKTSIKHLRKQMIKIESSVKTELKPNKIEVAFFPYNVTMWDSLESIYLAAKGDPDCDAYVVPIPYFEKNRDGSPSAMHYDGEKYPDDIPITDWQTYDVEARHPDVAFIHYAYDDMTRNASVHPLFFSKRLREHSDMLVYVPYYVTMSDKVEEYYGFLPGVLNAHRVITQSETMRQSFISHYTNYDKECGWGSRYGDANEKFVALGSPKYDKVMNARREDYRLPNEWERLIVGNGATLSGKCKKIILYNTHMFKWIDGGQQYFEKIRQVFDRFKNRDDMALWWRPHPNTEVNFRTQRPELLADYYAVIDSYKSEGWGIYDDTPDLHRAIAWSDAYYGDGSSVAKLFDMAGKPVMYQLHEKQIFGICATKKFVWILDYHNMLYRYDKESKKTEYIEMVSKRAANMCIAENNGKLCFAPYEKNDKISVFDTTQKSFGQIGFREGDKCDRIFNNAVSFKNFVFFIPDSFPAIMRLNAGSNEIDSFSNWIGAVSKLQVSKLHEVWEETIFWGSCTVEDEVAIVIYGASAIMFFNMETGKYEIRSVGEKPEQYSDICFDGQNYYMSTFCNDYVVKWSRRSNEVSTIKIPHFSRNEGLDQSFFIRYANGYVWLIPIYANNAYKINIATDEITELPELMEIFEDKKIDWHYNIASVYENTIYASTLNEGIVEYDTDTGEISFIESPTNFETQIVPKYLTSNLPMKKASNAEWVSSGDRIWEYVREASK